MSTEHDKPKLPPSSSEQDEHRLRALFDESAPEPASGVLQRMARAAAHIPEARRPWYRRLWARSPLVLGGLAAATAALAMWMNLGGDHVANMGAKVRRAQLETAHSMVAEGLSPELPGSDAALEELLAFDLTDETEDDLVALDADPLAAWDGGDEMSLAQDHPIRAMDLLFMGDSDNTDDVEMLGNIYEDILGEGG